MNVESNKVIQYGIEREFWLFQNARQLSQNAEHGYSTKSSPNPKKRLFGEYGVAMISSLLPIIGLFGKRALWKRLYSAKETCNFKEPTTRSHPIAALYVFWG